MRGLKRVDVCSLVFFGRVVPSRHPCYYNSDCTTGRNGTAFPKPRGLWARGSGVYGTSAGRVKGGGYDSRKV